jgi:hypothetical protein
VRLVKQGGSMSVLVPGQGPLLYRGCIEHAKARLICWFASVEVRAWEWVNAVYPGSRPNKIFLVVGQTLTPEFSIAHQEAHASDCEVVIEPSVGIPEIMDAHAIFGYDFQKVSASSGFRHFSTSDSTLHSVFMETFDSKVMKRIRFRLGSTLHSRVESAFR